MKLSRFAELVIQLVVAQEPRRAGWPALHHDAIKLLREETAAAEREASGLHTQKWGRAVRPPMVPVILDCGHRRSCRATVPLGYYVRCDACNETRRIVSKPEVTSPESNYSHAPCVPVAEYAALRELLRRVDMAEYGLAGREQPPLVQSVFNQLHAMRCKGFAP